jgi:hypothetical protein
MSKDVLEKCKTRIDFEKFAARHGGRVRNHGTHTIIGGPNGTTTIAAHGGEICPETRAKIIRWYHLIGLAAIAIGVLALAVGPELFGAVHP